MTFQVFKQAETEKDQFVSHQSDEQEHSLKNELEMLKNKIKHMGEDASTETKKQLAQLETQLAKLLAPLDSQEAPTQQKPPVNQKGKEAQPAAKTEQTENPFSNGKKPEKDSTHHASEQALLEDLGLDSEDYEIKKILIEKIDSPHVEEGTAQK